MDCAAAGLGRRDVTMQSWARPTRHGHHVHLHRTVLWRDRQPEFLLQRVLQQTLDRLLGHVSGQSQRHIVARIGQAIVRQINPPHIHIVDLRDQRLQVEAAGFHVSDPTSIEVLPGAMVVAAIWTLAEAIPSVARTALRTGRCEGASWARPAAATPHIKLRFTTAEMRARCIRLHFRTHVPDSISHFRVTWRPATVADGIRSSRSQQIACALNTSSPQTTHPLRIPL